MSDDPLQASVVLPTYNEAANLPLIIPRIARVLDDASIAGEIIVVDDNSPDGTSDVGRKLAEQYPVRVLQRTEERGLATAVLAGFAMSEAEVCVVIDADGSHPVQALPEMIGRILRGESEIVVGSRHVPGGGSADWSFFSRFKSRFAAAFAWPLSQMTDPTSGFMAVKRSLLAGLDLDPIGWKIVLEVVVKSRTRQLSEVPIVFSGRTEGDSKQSLSVLWEYFRHCARLYRFRFLG